MRKRGGLISFLGANDQGGAGHGDAGLPFASALGASSFNASSFAGAPARGGAAGTGELEGRLREAQAECDGLRRKVGQLQGQLAASGHKVHEATSERDRAFERVRELEEFLLPILARHERSRKMVQSSGELLRLQSRLATNAARELHSAMKGRNLEKVNKQHGTLEVRHVSVCFEDMQLVWRNPNEKGLVGGLISGISTGLSTGIQSGMHSGLSTGLSSGVSAGICGGSGSKSLDLATMTRLNYGSEASLTTRFPEVSPWLCFSVETADRSYAFVCPDEHAVIAFVLALSRACPDVPGVMPLRRDVILHKARCKLNEACSRKGKTFAGLLIEAGQLQASLRSVNFKAPAIPRAPSVRVARPAAAESRSFSQPARPRGSTSQGGGLICIESFLAVSSSPPVRRGAWPKAGEVWAFTGVVDEVDLFRDPSGSEWANRIKCVDKATGRRAVTILSAPESQSLVEIRGLDKIKFVKGWLKVVDDSETWLVEKVSHH